ncbi:carbohydrate sulfotransferase 1-like [Saccoglossus kowalevskii]|uniref:Carbohydrate sulfotransferase 1-like n=1 Tax=Saccoglossus kowalevskii TaxID=10224 RepID=A0ABM0ML59_SACKO|nr:PREDICTED: carbohydrate sulfotransferase 1-like [Saccoglossus kowalevskii]
MERRLLRTVLGLILLITIIWFLSGRNNPSYTEVILGQPRMREHVTQTNNSMIISATSNNHGFTNSFQSKRTTYVALSDDHHNVSKLSPEQEMTHLHKLASDIEQRVLNRKEGIHVLVLARLRTGSTFTSNYIAMQSDSLYLGEPEATLSSHAYDLFNDSASYVEQLQKPFYTLLGDFFDCNFNNHVLLSHTNSTRCKGLTNQRGRVHNATFTFSWITEKCRSKNMYIVKTTHMSDISKGLDTLKKYNVKVIHLVRDPRAMINSRIKYEQAHARNRYERLRRIDEMIKHYCIWLKTNVDVVIHGPDWLKKHYMIIRYEDICGRSEEILPKLRSFLDLPSNEGIIPRILKSSVDSWRNTLTFNYTAIAQDNCPDEVFKMLGYVKLKNIDQQHDSSFSLMTPSIPPINKLTVLNHDGVV